MKRLRIAALIVALLAAGFFAGRASASYQVTSTDPAWTFQTGMVEQQVATFAKANGITTQSGWDTFVNGLTAGQSIAVSQGILRSVKCSVP